MVIKTCFSIQYDPKAILGFGVVSGVAPINPPRISRLDSDLIYVIIPQYVHREKSYSVNGPGFEDRIFVAGVDEDGVTIRLFTINIYEMLYSHYGKIQDNIDLKILVNRTSDGQVIIDPSTTKFKMFKNAELPLTMMKDGRAYINRPFAFKVAGRYTCYRISEIEVKGSNTREIETFLEDGKEYAKLLPMTINEYEEIEEVPYVDIRTGNEISPYINNLPIMVNCPKEFQGEYVIPEGVKYIQRDAFCDCTGITSIIIPSSIVDIDNQSFIGCTNLVSIKVASGNKRYDSRNDCNAIIKTNTDVLILGCQSTSIPNNVTSIGKAAFSGCSGLSSITIPDSVTKIGESAFVHCTGLTSVTIPNSVTSIGKFAFDGCTNLAHIEIPNSVTNIEYHAFYGCTNLQNVSIHNAYIHIDSSSFENETKIIDKDGVEFSHSRTKLIRFPKEFKGEYVIPDGVTTIGEYAFPHDSCGLISLTIPKSLVNIDHCGSAFDTCADLIEIVVSKSNLNFSSEDGVLYNNDRSTLIKCPIGKHGEFVIPQSVTKIGDGAFCFCKNLTSIIIPDSVTNIGAEAFRECSSLTSITIPKDVTYVGRAAISGCTSMISICVHSGNTIFDSRENCDAIIETATNTLVAGCKNTYIPESIETIGEEAFVDCAGLINISIPKGITKIGSCAFLNCTHLETIEIPENVIDIGARAFQSCLVLTSINLSASIKNIGEAAFFNCSSLRKIYIPNGQTARFAHMNALGDVTHLFVERDNEELTILVNLAKAYEKGVGVSQSVTQALVTYMQAAEKGSAEAAYHFGEWYRDGKNVPIDKEKALSYFQQAAKSGYSDAEKRAEEVQKEIEEQQRQEQEKLRKEEEVRRMEEQRKHPKYIFFDTETTGLPPKNMYNASPSRSDVWPRMVQLAWLLVDNDGNIIKQRSAIIYPEGFTIPQEAVDIHHISTQRAKREGLPLRDVLEEFMQDFNKAECLVAHNIEFDQHIIGAELYRLDIPYQSFMNKKSICTMRSSTDYCMLPNTSGYGDFKWPKLEELYSILFDRKFEDAHDALADITATKECFFELRKRGII